MRILIVEGTARALQALRRLVNAQIPFLPAPTLVTAVLAGDISESESYDLVIVGPETDEAGLKLARYCRSVWPGAMTVLVAEVGVEAPDQIGRETWKHGIELVAAHVCSEQLPELLQIASFNRTLDALDGHRETVLGRDYETVRCLGVGSTGVVFACRHRELPGHSVAVKVLLPRAARNDSTVRRFQSEVCAAYGVDHPNVLRVHEFIQTDDVVAYCMEFVDGGNLAGRMGWGESLALHDVSDILIQICRGMQAVHAAQLIHGNLKPEDVLVTVDGLVKISDFGRAHNDPYPHVLAHDGVMGVIDYVAPEYIEHQQLDPRADIYALGCIAYEMITGTTPFRSESVYDTLMRRLHADILLPSALRSGCPPELEAIVLKAMSLSPEKRYQSAGEMERALIGLHFC